MRILSAYFLLCIIMLSGTANAGEYAILFHRAKTDRDAKDYISRMNPIFAAATRVIEQTNRFLVIYGDLSTKEEADQVYRSFVNDKNFNWVEVIHVSDKGAEKASTHPEAPSFDKLSNTILSALPESVTNVDISNLYINRIIAPSSKKIKDIIIEKDSGVQVQIEGKNAFITFLKKQNPVTKEVLYQVTPVSIYAVIEPDIVYTIIATPKSIDSQIIELKYDQDHIKKNLAYFNGLPLEKKILKMIKSAITDKMPDSFTRKRVGQTLPIFKDLDIYHAKDVIAEGEGLILKEFVLALRKNPEHPEIRLTEKQFMIPELSTKPLGITLENFILNDQLTKTRLFIVERKDNI
ncbi:MAG: type-F conjugative transfer system secretin TraK [Proteobacteria bacterium]|nr:type-F conjugative transfer system secretin TraK [Pseudomonadota bacterium]